MWILTVTKVGIFEWVPHYSSSFVFFFLLIGLLDFALKEEICCCYCCRAAASATATTDFITTTNHDLGYIWICWLGSLLLRSGFFWWWDKDKVGSTRCSCALLQKVTFFNISAPKYTHLTRLSEEFWPYPGVVLSLVVIWPFLLTVNVKELIKTGFIYFSAFGISWHERWKRLRIATLVFSFSHVRRFHTLHQLFSKAEN